MSLNSYAQRVLQDSVVAKYPWEKEFIQSVTEVFESLGPLLDRESKYEKNCILERIVVPERIIQFRVQWVDPQVPRLRTDLQELPHHAPHGRRQGRLQLQSEGQVRP